MKYIIISIIALIILFFSFKNKAPLPQAIDSESVEKIAIPLSKEYTLSNAGNWDIFTEGGKDYMCFIASPKNKEKQTHRILVYDFASKKIISNAPLAVFENAKKSVCRVNIINFDSVFINFVEGEYPDFVEDSTIVLVNTQGKTLKVINMDDLGVPTHKNLLPMDARSNAEFALSDIPFMNNKLFIPLRRPRIGYDSSGIKYIIPSVTALNINTNELNSYKAYIPPKTITHQPYPQECPTPRVSFTLDNKVLLSFGYTSAIWIWDEKTNESNVKYIKPSVLIDSIKSIPIGKTGRPDYFDIYSPEAGGYVQIMANPYKKQYLRLLALPPNYYGYDKYFNAYKTGMMLLDEKFNVIGEGISNVQLFYTQPKFISKGLLALDLEKQEDYIEAHGELDSLFFQILDIKITNKKVNPKPTNKISERIEEYISTYYKEAMKKERSVVVISSVEPYCKNCLQNLEDKIGKKVNQVFFPNTYFLLIFDNKTIEKSNYITTLGLDSPNIWTDDTKKYEPYMNRPLIPQVYFLERGKIVKKSSVTPANEDVVLSEIQHHTMIK